MATRTSQGLRDQQRRTQIGLRMQGWAPGHMETCTWACLVCAQGLGGGSASRLSGIWNHKPGAQPLPGDLSPGETDSSMGHTLCWTPGVAEPLNKGWAACAGDRARDQGGGWAVKVRRCPGAPSAVPRGVRPLPPHRRSHAAGREELVFWA